ncbi:MAG: sugar phosphate isomerase/epimerase family protein [Mycobacteriales bacterium]
MAEIGVFTNVFARGTPAEVAEAVRAAGFTVTQLDLPTVGFAELTALTPQEAREIGSAFAVAGVRIWGVEATFNAIDPDHARREAGTRGCIEVIERAADLGAEVVTLCTGTRDPERMWRAHPDNASPAAWQDLLVTMRRLIPAAAAAGVRLGIEPEPSNVVRDTDAAVRLLDELGTDRLGIVLDPANLLSIDTMARQQEILIDGFARLGPHTVVVHAKDLDESGFTAPGLGRMDYALVRRLHRALPSDVPLIAQDLTADDTARVLALLTG